MLFKKTLLAVAALAFVGVASAASPATAQFDVKIKIVKSCSVLAGAGSVIDFSSQEASAFNLQGSSSISVTCAKRTAYNIGLVPSNNNAVGAGVMNSLIISPADTVSYQLRKANGMSAAIWGNAGIDTVAGVGTGVAIPTPVYATVNSANSTPDDYIDTVTVSVVY